MTDLNALTDSWLIEAKKLPAAPALRQVSDHPEQYPPSEYAHYEVDGAQFLDTALDGILDTLDLAHIHGPDANDLRTLSGRGDIARGRLGLFNIPTDNTGVGAQVNHGAYLGAADGACATGTEDDLVGCRMLVKSSRTPSDMGGGAIRTEQAILPGITDVLY